MPDDRPLGRPPAAPKDDDNDHDEPPTALEADHDEIERFVTCLFRYADPGAFVSLRVFHQTNGSPERLLGVPVDDLATLIDEATETATWCAALPHGVVFAPPICTLNDRYHARVENLVNGLALSVEQDVFRRAILTP